MYIEGDYVDIRPKILQDTFFSREISSWEIFFRFSREGVLASPRGSVVGIWKQIGFTGRYAYL